MSNNNFCVFLDAGHGGRNKYGEYVTAGKQYEHKIGDFHYLRHFYEGVFNRIITNRVANKLRELGILYKIVSHDYLDTELEYRIALANWYHKHYKKGIYISNHANASNSGKARGFEVYTSPGKTAADQIAEYHWKNVKDLLGNRISYRSDTSDHDHDREAKFKVLTMTAMPAILIEHLFFDNFKDAKLLMDDEVIERFAEAQVRTIIQYMNTL